MKKTLIQYATSNEFKKQEIAQLLESGTFLNSQGSETKIGDRFEFVFPKISTDEPLEINLEVMVKHKARSAYRSLLVPCIVEHAGLILKKNYDEGFPGGLTQPMWDALESDEFLRRTGAVKEAVVARAVVGYCDGMSVRTFIGETEGILADTARGDIRQFYWDTVFCPVELGDDTYAEICEDSHRGLAVKMQISQSYRALRQFLTFKDSTGGNDLFPTG